MNGEECAECVKSEIYAIKIENIIKSRWQWRRSVAHFFRTNPIVDCA